MLVACGAEKADESKAPAAEPAVEVEAKPEGSGSGSAPGAAKPADAPAPVEQKEEAPAAPAKSDEGKEKKTKKQAAASESGGEKGSWSSWRGPLQNGMSLETYGEWAFVEEPAWTFDRSMRGTPVVFDGVVYAFNYDERSNEDVREYLTALDEETGEVLWEHEFIDFISDTVYNRYAVGSPVVDEETGDIYLMLTNGLFTCFSPEGDIKWQHSMMERFGRLTFPNGRAGAPVLDGDFVIVRGVTSFWGAQGPARDRFFAFDKPTGDLVWTSTPGVGPPFLKDSSFSTPYFETRDGKRVFYAGTGCGNVVCVNALTGEPIWRYQAAKGGINSSPIIHGGDKLIYINDKVNVHSSTKGGMVALKLPEDLSNPGGEVDEAQGGAPALPVDTEIWRNDLMMFTSSPVLMGDRVYQVTMTGDLCCVDPETGEVLWTEKLGTSQIHAGPIGIDGLLYVPMNKGAMYVVKPSDNGAEILHEIDFNAINGTEGESCLGAPAVAGGKLFVGTTSKLYCFDMDVADVVFGEAPEEEALVAGEAVALRPVPSDVLLTPGSEATFRVDMIDEAGVVVGEAEDVEWKTFIPPTAKVKTEMDATFSEAGVLVAGPDAKMSAGAFKGKSGELEGVTRGRILPNLPMSEDFESFELTVDHATDDVTFAYPPLPWIGARFKWEVRDLDGEKVLAKTLDRILFQRALSFIGEPDSSDYTLQADLMTDGNRRTKSVVGLINQKYNISLKGNSNQLEVSSNFERLQENVPFTVDANTWYTLKSRVDVNDDGSGVVRAKAWPRGEDEPAEWTIEVDVENAHAEGSPGLYAFSPRSLMRVYVDNISITPNE
ncbi:MAG: PQQ-binding-like beta-propeller repeat protein [Verrucomicrobiota bacterium]